MPVCFPGPSQPWKYSDNSKAAADILNRTAPPAHAKNTFQNNYQQDDTYGLSFISGLVVLHSTCFELQGAKHVGERVEYSKRLYSMPEAACTVKK